MRKVLFEQHLQRVVIRVRDGVLGENVQRTPGCHRRGSPVPVNGLHRGEEYCRKPTNVDSIPAVPVCRCRRCLHRAGTRRTAVGSAVRQCETADWNIVARRRRNTNCLPTAVRKLRCGSLSKVEIACRSLQVCGFPWFSSYAGQQTMALRSNVTHLEQHSCRAIARFMVKLYWSEYCVRSSSRKLSEQ